MDPLFDAAARLVAEPIPGDNAAPVTVSEIAGRLKRVVEGEFGHVRIRGEISGYKRVASGHAYLCLKDDKAVIDGVIWKTAFGAVPFAPTDGIEVIATGRLTTYPGRSKYQVIIERLELAGEGALMALLEKLKARLGAEGLFDADRKKPLPFLPRTIGVVTSPTGAVIRDILHRLADRCPSHVVVWPVKVQGEGAAGEIAAAIAGFDALPPDSPMRPDLLIVARGGGSIEDLWAFNEEAVVRAIAACSIPLISAVGHETDTSLSDHAADLRAPTPTAAAELAVPVLAELRAEIAAQAARTERCARRYHARAGEKLAALVRVLPRQDALLGPQRQRADDLAQRLDRGLERRVVRARTQLDRSAGALRPAMLDRQLAEARARLGRCDALPAVVERRLMAAGDRLDRVARLLQSLDPERPLERGYAWVAGRGGRVVATAAAARGAGALTLHFRDGIVDARVERAGGKTYARASGEQPSLL